MPRASPQLTSASGSPWTFHPHPAAWAVIGVLLLFYAWLLTRRSSGAGSGVGPRRWLYLGAGLVSLAVATTWPLADLGAHWSLTALLGQRLLLTLAVAPLLLMALPPQTIARLTRPAWVDAVLSFFTRPAVAVVTFSVVAIGTLATVAVAAQASSGLTRAGIDLLLFAGGVVLWGPVLRHIPGASRSTPLGTAVYLFVQSIIPTFPAVVFIFSNHPIYSTFASTHGALGMSSLGDQHLAGIVAKVATLPVLWTAAWVVMSRAESADAGSKDPYPLTWAEVERQLERAERAERRGPVRRPKVRAIPRPVAGGWSSTGQAEDLDTSGPDQSPPRAP
ncbi:MAG: cytochrome c oxidase assembly protein [Acidimicrobiales bacterium]